MLFLYKVLTPRRLFISCGTTVLKRTRTNLCFLKNANILKNMKKHQQVREKSFLRFFGKESMEKIKEKDNVPDVYQLIYRNTMSKYSFLRFFGKESMEKIKEKDNVPDVYQLIYRNTMSKYLLTAQIFSIALAGFVCVNLIVSQAGDVLYDTWRTTPGAVKNEVYVYMTVIILISVTMQLFVARMPLRIYHYPKQNQYTMISYGALPGTTRRLTYGLNELTRLESGVLPWTESSYEIKDQRKVILIEKYFRTPADLNIMLGYQKPPEDED
ncbi:hypothetical protein AMK59_29 [Oryctes borbonicus]|uniref:Uncharacterized protein n=1 Tax=Oryctes borbonicus TaxID=1629725 RepID=A0A0T6BAM1_9SCAR|nr:hypothetical protein AMK59_29 [Oryctes borbonicus]